MMTDSLVAEMNARSEPPGVRPAANQRALLALAGITLLGAVLQFYQIGSRAYFGDEFASLDEARNLGANPHSLPYFLLLKFWMTGGDSEAWLRSLAAVFGIVAIPMMYWLATHWVDRRTALVAALLMATSAFKVDFGQEIRYYSLFLCASLLSAIATSRVLRNHGRSSLICWMLAGFLCCASHGIGILLVVAEASVIFALWVPRHRLRRGLIILGVLLASLLVLLVPQVTDAVFNLVSRYINSTTSYAGARGLSMSQFAKIPVAVFQLVFGQHVYPMDWWLVVPGTIVTFLTVSLVTWRWRSRPDRLAFVLAMPLVCLGLLFLLLDSLTSLGLAGASARHAMFVLPFTLLAIAAGTDSGSRSLRWALTSGTVAVNLVSLGFFYFGTWSPSGDLMDWRGAASFVNQHANTQTMVLVDGRASRNADIYLSTDFPQRSAWAYANGKSFGDLTDHSRVIFVSNDDRPDMRRTLNDIHDRISEQYTQVGAWVQYPLFVSIYDRKPTPGSDLAVDAGTGVVSLPREVYGLEFQDLRLPAQAWDGGRSIPIQGAVSIPAPNGARERVFRLANDPPSRSLLILSNLTEAAAIPRGADVATVTLTGADGSVVTQALRNGIETADWGAACDPTSGCRVAFTWHKRIALVGRRAFDRAWDDFPSNVFGSYIALPERFSPQTIEIRSVSPSVRLHIWGLVTTQ